METKGLVWTEAALFNVAAHAMSFRQYNMGACPRNVEQHAELSSRKAGQDKGQAASMIGFRVVNCIVRA